jgi:hypothetical protein
MLPYSLVELYCVSKERHAPVIRAEKRIDFGKMKYERDIRTGSSHCSYERLYSSQICFGAHLARREHLFGTVDKIH